MTRLILWMTVLTLAYSTSVQAGNEGAITIQSKVFHNALTAYAQVRPIRLLTVQTLVSGQVEDLSVLPGQHVQADQALARLKGISQSAQIIAAEAAVNQALAAFNLAQQNYAGIAATYPDVSTRQQLFTAKAAVNDARAKLISARSQLALIQGGGMVRAPGAGTVVSLSATNGQNVTAATPLLVLQLDHSLWLEAEFYGTAKQDVAIGMGGMFHPADGGKPVAVTVRSVANQVGSDGGLSVNCIPVGGSTWFSGETGNLVLNSGNRSWPSLPSQALILDAGNWWVVISEHGHYRNQMVTIGPEEDGWTAVTSGLKAGEQVQVTHAYRIYHRNFAIDYQQPD
ncbi:MAG: efflux RND transporter periplasmic adaptor subunit [Burkholderiales bacterium]|nr:efflux RND transporter periplasmic adaptor subunit [Burkholderiales bacterium]